MPRGTKRIYDDDMIPRIVARIIPSQIRSISQTPKNMKRVIFLLVKGKLRIKKRPLFQPISIQCFWPLFYKSAKTLGGLFIFRAENVIKIERQMVGQT